MKGSSARITLVGELTHRRRKPERRTGSRLWRTLATFGLSAAILPPSAQADTHHVNRNNPTPAPPYLTWETAATSIQDAVDVASSNDTVIVTDGVYDTGGGVTPGYSCVNRVVITNDIVVQSLNGPEATFIVGQGPLGSNAVRGVYMSAGLLNGFTVTNGRTMISGDQNHDRSGGGVNLFGGNGVVSNCTLTGNSADASGGGSYYGTLIHCKLTGNTASVGGGSVGGALNVCTLINNSARLAGGGCYSSVLSKCTLAGNYAGIYGGGSYAGFLTNCTLTGNLAGAYGGGSYNGTLKNCIIYFNTAIGGSHNWYGLSSFYSISYCCTTPTANGTGNITNDPLLVSSSHVATNSPCRGAGNASYASGVDIDGEPWLNPPSIGCDENAGFGDVTGTVSFALEGPSMIVEGWTEGYIPVFEGPVTQTAVDFGNGLVVTNHVIGEIETSWLNTGLVEVIMTAWNDDHPGGIIFTQTIKVLSATATGIFVSDAAGDDANDGRSWANAKKTIQAGVDAQDLHGGVVWVTNGLYNVGGAVTPGFSCMNRVVITNDISIRSINGPEATFIVGQGPAGSNAVRGVFMSAGVLDGFTVTNGHTWTSGNAQYDRSGGGIILAGGQGVVSHSVITGNSADESGGGSSGGTLNNCTLSGNSAANDGGGSNGSTLNNCTLTGNSAENGGGSSYGTLTNCTLSENVGAIDGGGSYYGALGACTLSGNSAENGGGSCHSSLVDCTLSGNSAVIDGGGSYGGTLSNCTLTGNSAERGGGSHAGVLNDCTLTGNVAKTWGGGSFLGTLSNCRLAGNSAVTLSGGGSCLSTLNNCVLSGNAADNSGGGSYLGTLNNCTVTGNSAVRGGGSHKGTLNNCIIYYNTATTAYDNGFESTLSYCCTVPAAGGTGNITNHPLLVSTSHIATNSPCRGAGSAAYVSGTDIDGEVWLNPPSIGCDENAGFGSVTGTVTFSLQGPLRILEGQSEGYLPVFAGPVTRTTVDFGNGLVVTNHIFGRIEASWPAAGFVDVILTAWNDEHPSGIFITQTIEVLTFHASAIFVSDAAGDDANDGRSWATAKKTLQAGVDTQVLNGGIVWVTNGVYAVGGAITPGYSCMNRVVITNDITLQSINGPEATFIVGQGPIGTNAVRGAYLCAGVLSGFTITNGHTFIPGDVNFDVSGGGVNLAGGLGVVSNCVLTGNAGYGGGGSFRGTLGNCTFTANSAVLEGGGSWLSTLNNCVLTGNAAYTGGGSHSGTLNNCTLTDNSADYGGGSYSATLNNCIIYFNTAILSGQSYNWSGGTLSNCCTVPAPGGTGNITNYPQFVTAAAGNSRLLEISPCIDAGANAYVVGLTDLDGQPRIVGAAVDMGAYEYGMTANGDADGDGLPDWWEILYFAGPTNANPTALCRNGVNTTKEAYIAGFYPTAPEAGFAIESIERAPAGTVVTWHPVTGRVYSVSSTTNLGGGFFPVPGAQLLPWTQSSFTSSLQQTDVPCLYRIDVRIEE